eukprot:gene5282-5950_t
MASRVSRGSDTTQKQRESSYSTKGKSPDLWSPGNTSRVNKLKRDIPIPSIEISTDEDIGIGSDDDDDEGLVLTTTNKKSFTKQHTSAAKKDSSVKKEIGDKDSRDVTQASQPRPGLVKRAAFKDEIPDDKPDPAKDLLSMKTDPQRDINKDRKSVEPFSKHKDPALSDKKMSKSKNSRDGFQDKAELESREGRKYKRTKNFENYEDSDSDDDDLSMHNEYRKQLKDSSAKRITHSRADRGTSEDLANDCPGRDVHKKESQLHGEKSTQSTVNITTTDSSTRPRLHQHERGLSQDDNHGTNHGNEVVKTPRTGLVDDMFSSGYRQPVSGKGEHLVNDGRSSRSGSSKGDTSMRPRSGSSKDDNATQPRSGSSKGDISMRPRSGSSKGDNAARPRSGSNKGDTSMRPHSGSSKGDNAARPQSGSNKGDTSMRPHSGSNKDDNAARPRSGSNKGDTSMRPRSGSSKDEDLMRPRSRSGKEGILKQPSSSDISSRSDNQPRPGSSYSRESRKGIKDSAFTSRNNSISKNQLKDFDSDDDDDDDSDYEVSASINRSPKPRDAVVADFAADSRSASAKIAGHRRAGSLGSVLLKDLNEQQKSPRESDMRHYRSKSDLDKETLEESRLRSKQREKEDRRDEFARETSKSPRLRQVSRSKDEEVSGKERKDSKVRRNSRNDEESLEKHGKPRIKNNLGPRTPNRTQDPSGNVKKKLHGGGGALLKNGPLKADANVTRAANSAQQKSTHSPRKMLGKSMGKRSQSFTNISNISPKSPYSDVHGDDLRQHEAVAVDSASLREVIYYDWLKKKEVNIKKEVVVKKQLKKEQDDEAEREKEEKRLISKKAFEAWASTKSEEEKEKIALLHTKKKAEKEKQEEEQQKKMDSKKYFESWKEKKLQALTENERKQKKEKREKREKELQDKEDKEQSAKKVYESWKSKKEEVLKEEAKQKKLQKKEERMAEYEKQEKKKKAEKAFESWREKKPAGLQQQRTRPTLTQRAWCPSGRNNANVVPEHVQPVIQRNPPARTRTLSATARGSLRSTSATS